MTNCFAALSPESTSPLSDTILKPSSPSPFCCINQSVTQRASTLFPSTTSIILSKPLGSMSSEYPAKRSPSGGHERRGDRRGSRHPIRDLTRSSAARNDHPKPTLQDRYSPEDLFLMLKEYEFDGRLASVGIQGPAESEGRPDSESSDSSSPSHFPASSKTGKQDIWTDEAEFAFLAGEPFRSIPHVRTQRLTERSCSDLSRTLSTSSDILESDVYAETMRTQRDHCLDHHLSSGKTHDSEASIVTSSSGPTA
jgi:hypothetical protein